MKLIRSITLAAAGLFAPMAAQGQNSAIMDYIHTPGYGEPPFSVDETARAELVKILQDPAAFNYHGKVLMTLAAAGDSVRAMNDIYDYFYAPIDSSLLNESREHHRASDMKLRALDAARLMIALNATSSGNAAATQKAYDFLWSFIDRTNGKQVAWTSPADAPDQLEMRLGVGAATALASSGTPKALEMLDRARDNLALKLLQEAHPGTITRHAPAFLFPKLATGVQGTELYVHICDLIDSLQEHLGIKHTEQPAIQQ